MSILVARVTESYARRLGCVFARRFYKATLLRPNVDFYAIRDQFPERSEDVARRRFNEENIELDTAG
jgi:hypothetical protein